MNRFSNKVPHQSSEAWTYKMLTVEMLMCCLMLSEFKKKVPVGVCHGNSDWKTAPVSDLIDEVGHTPGNCPMFFICILRNRSVSSADSIALRTCLRTRRANPLLSLLEVRYLILRIRISWWTRTLDQAIPIRKHPNRRSEREFVLRWMALLKKFTCLEIHGQYKIMTL